MGTEEPNEEPRQRRLSDDADAIKDEIDEVLSEDAEEFVRSYVQKGGQGWSTFVDPSFFVGAATASIAAAVTYDAFKQIVATVVHAVNRIPGPVTTNVYGYDDVLDDNFVYVLEEAWETASALLRKKPARHTIDEATALHWTVFFKELLAREPLVRLNPDHMERLKRAGAARPENLTPSQLVAMIVEQWLVWNPNAEIGIWS